MVSSASASDVCICFDRDLTAMNDRISFIQTEDPLKSLKKGLMRCIAQCLFVMLARLSASLKEMIFS